MLAVLLAVAGLAGCAANDDAGENRDPGMSAQLTSEQKAQLRDSAKVGDYELITTASRMAWDNPEAAVSLADYAADLMPEKGSEISASILRASSR